MKILIGNTSLSDYNDGLDFDKSFERFNSRCDEIKAELNRAVLFEMETVEEHALMNLAGGEAGILKGLKESTGKIGKTVGRVGKGVGHKIVQALNWLAESLGQMWDSLMKYDKKYSELPKKIKEAREKLQTGNIGEMAKYKFYDVDVDTLKKATVFLDFKTFLDFKVSGLELGGVFDPKVVGEIFENVDDKPTANQMSFLEKSTKLRKALENIGQEGLIYNIFKIKKFKDVKSESSGDGDKKGLSERFIETIIGDKVEIEGPDFVTAASRYLAIMEKLAGDKIILKNLRKSGEELKSLTKRLGNVIKRASAPAKSAATEYARNAKDAANDKRDEVREGLEKENEGKDEDKKKSDRDIDKEVESNKDVQTNEGLSKDAENFKSEVNSNATVIGSIITNTFMTTTKTTLGVYKMLLDDAYTAMSYIHSL